MPDPNPYEARDGMADEAPNETTPDRFWRKYWICLGVSVLLSIVPVPAIGVWNRFAEVRISPWLIISFFWIQILIWCSVLLILLVGIIRWTGERMHGIAPSRNPESGFD